MPMLRTPPTPPPGTLDGQPAPRVLLIENRRGKRTALFFAVAAVTFGLALITEMPARAALTLSGSPQVWSDVAGSAWRGEVALRDRVRVAWDADLGRSLVLAALATDVEATAPETDLRGQARLRPGSVVLERVRGTAGWPLIAAFLPQAPFTCDVDIRVDVPWMAFGGDRQGAEGELVSGAGPCAVIGIGGAPRALPALTVQATRNDAATTVVVAPRDNRADRLAEATLTRTGRLTAAVLPAGSALLSGVAIPVRVERQL